MWTNICNIKINFTGRYSWIWDLCNECVGVKYHSQYRFMLKVLIKAWYEKFECLVKSEYNFLDASSPHSSFVSSIGFIGAYSDPTVYP